QMLAAKLAGAQILIARDHLSWSSVTPWSVRLSSLVFSIQSAVILMVGMVFLRRGMREGVRYCGAAGLAFILTGKVFSPQYLIWLIPYIAVLEGPVARRGRWLFAAGCVATLMAPGTTSFFPRTSAWVILAYNLKNALFLGLLALLTFGPVAGEAKEPDQVGSSGGQRPGARTRACRLVSGRRWTRSLHRVIVNEHRRSNAMNPDLLEAFAAGAETLRRAVDGLNRDDLLARPGPGDWSIQELVIHVVDSDAIAIDRMKRILIEENPPLLYADESAYIARLFPDEQ